MAATHDDDASLRALLDAHLPGQVLLVEDDPDLQGAFAEALRRAGHTTDIASDGREALDMLLTGRSQPRGILLDMHMPTMDGPEFLAIKTGEAAIATIPVVLMTADESAARTGGIDERVSAVLSKPVTIADLVGMVDRVAGAPRRAAEGPSRATRGTS